MQEDSWETSSRWYDKIVGPKGHYYHQKVVLPGIMKLLNLNPGAKVVDLACGQGVLARHLPKGVSYLGIDASPSLIRSAETAKVSPLHRFLTADLTKPLRLDQRDFSHATIILALQNISDPKQVLQNASHLLKEGGQLLIVLSHPCFRIPRQSSWQVDEAKKLQFRRIDRYLSPLKIPIQTHPGQGEKSPETWSYHHPLSSYSKWLEESGFVIELIDEWCSDKKSTGKTAPMENRCREEFPLFLAIRATKRMKDKG
ncbi:MAG: class I SAM-dependent methyltransferase [Chlamydiales bacterium]